MPYPKSSRVSFSLSSSVALLFAVAGSAPAEEPKSDRPAIAVWVRHLGSTVHEEREKAEVLLGSADDAAPALTEALKSSDPEVRRRAARALQVIERRRNLAALARLRKFVKEGRVDLVTDLLVRWPQWDDEADAWQAVVNLAEKMIALEARTFGKRSVPENEGAPLGDFRRYLSYWGTGIVNDSRRVRWKNSGSASFVAKVDSFSSETKDKRILSSLLVSSGDVGVDHAGLSFIFAGGSVEVETMSDTLVVCDGDFTINHVMGSCLVIARGAIRCRSGVADCRLISADRVNDGEANRYSQVAVREKEVNPLGFVKFFDLKHVGLATETGEDGLRVKAVDKGSRAARAGLRAGDVLLTADAKKVASAEAFRKLVRGAVAEGRAVPLTVRRADRDLTLSLAGDD